MNSYKLSKAAKKDLIRIHHFGVKQFGVRQDDKYFNAFFDQFEIIAQRPYSFEAVDFIKPGYRRCVCGVDSIYFKVKGNQVLIMAVLGRQEFKAD